MPSLQNHMFRVAVVAKTISDSTQKSVNSPDILTACLLHDMGNIIKFNLDLFPDFLEPEGREYWQKVKNDFVEKYGNDEHEATLQIVSELGQNERISELVDAFSFRQAKANYESGDVGRMICTYSDMRVEPHGVVSLEDRLRDGTKRFRINKPGIRDEELFKEMSRYLKKIEEYIFHSSSLSPKDITDDLIVSNMKQLKEFEILF